MGRQLQDEMYVVAHDPDPENSRCVSVSDLGENPSQKLRSSGMDEW